MNVFRHLSAAMLALPALAMTGCAGPIETLGAASGQVPPVLAVRVVSAPDSAGPASDQARAAVADALAARGYAVSSEAPATVVVGVAERDARIAIGAPGAQAISPAKHQRFLQSCGDRTQRLTLAFYPGADAEPARAFAEEHHCKGELADSMAALANEAVDALFHPGAARRTFRAGRD